MNLTSSKKTLLPSGVTLGILVCILAYFGGPKNMAVCVACFIRDSAGAVKLHTAAVVQYFRPEIVDFVYGSFLIALATREHRLAVGPSPVLRFILGATMMVGSLTSLGCPLHTVTRMATGDLNAHMGFIGFAAGVFTGTIALKNGFSLGRAHETGKVNGAALPAVLAVSFVLSLATALFASDERGPGSMHVPTLLALVMTLLLGAIVQRCRTCFVDSIRDVTLMKNFDLVTVVGGPFVVILVPNLATGRSKLSFAGQPVVYSQYIQNILGLHTVGFAAIPASGCPLCQLVSAGQGSSGPVVTFLGLLMGAVLCHSFRLAAPATAAIIVDTPAAPGGLTMAGEVVVIGRIVTPFIIGFVLKSEEGEQEVRDICEVDARGSSCPKPTMLTATALEKCKGEPVKMLVSGSHTRMNVEKYAKSQGKTAIVTEKGSESEIMTEQYRCPGFIAYLSQGF